MLPFHVRDNSDAYSVDLVNLVDTDLQLGGLLLVFFGESLLQTFLHSLRHGTLWKILGALDDLHLFLILLLLFAIASLVLLLDVATGTGVGGRGLIPPSVEERTNLMHPFMAVVALNPCFFGESIVLVLLQRGLAHFATIVKGHGLGIFQQTIARSTPVVLLRGIGVVEGIATNALHTACAVAIQHRRLKEASLGTTQGT